MQPATPYFDQASRKSGTIGYASGMRSFVSVHHCPMGAFDWRGNDLDDDVVSTSGGRPKPRRGKKALFSRIIFPPLSSRNVKKGFDVGIFYICFPTKKKNN